MTRPLKIVVLLLAAFLIMFAAGLSTQAYAGEDTTAPVLKGIEVLTPSVTVGESIQIQIEVDESETGLARASIQLNSGSGTGNTRTLSAVQNWEEPQFSTDEGNIVYTFNVETSAETINADWFVAYLELHDSKGNWSRYCGSEGSQTDVVRETDNGLDPSQTVTGTTHVVTTGSLVEVDQPVLNWVKALTPEVEKGGVLEVQANITAKRDLDVTIVCYEVENPQYDAEVKLTGSFSLSNAAGTKTHTLKVKVPASVRSGVWRIEYVVLEDANKNESLYDIRTDDGEYLTCNEIADSRADTDRFTVLGDPALEDRTIPQLNAITVDQSSKVVKKPEVLPVTIDVEEEGSGISCFTIFVAMVETSGGYSESAFYTFKTKEYYQNVDNDGYTGKLFDKPLKTGKYKVELPISSTMKNGEYKVIVQEIKDRAGNSRWNENFRVKGIDIADYFAIEDEFQYDFEAGISNPSLKKKAAVMKVGTAAKILLNKTGKNILKKEVLDEIAGKDKTLVLYQSGYQWIINGKDITKSKTKDLDLSVTVTTVRAADLGIKKNAAGLVFADNGTLPGTVQFRFKSACMKEFANDDEVLRLYYVKSSGPTDRDRLNLEGVTFSEESSQMEIVPDGSSTWCYVDITHNSSYVVSGQKIVMKKNPMKVKAVKKKVKAKALKKKAKTIKPIVVKKAKGKVSYKVVGGSKKAKKVLKLNKKTGKIKVKKGTKKGTYKIKVKVTASGKGNYKKMSQKVTVKVIVK